MFSDRMTIKHKTYLMQKSPWKSFLPASGVGPADRISSKSSMQLARPQAAVNSGAARAGHAEKKIKIQHSD
jgi:hypothetical protein